MERNGELGKGGFYLGARRHSTNRIAELKSRVIADSGLVVDVECGRSVY